MKIIKRILLITVLALLLINLNGCFKKEPLKNKNKIYNIFKNKYIL